MKISKKNTLLITFNIIKKNTVNKKLFFLVCKIKDVYIFLVDAKNVKDKGGGPLKQFWCHISFFSSAGKGGGRFQRIWRLFLNVCTTRFCHILDKISSHSLI